MFTGLVETTGQVLSLAPHGEQARLTLAIPFASELQPGESVAVNGCCLTVDDIGPGRASFDLLAQTLRVTSLGVLREGSRVNLERAMRAGDRFGGHFVQGHVDGTGEVLAWEASGQDHRLEVSVPAELLRLCIDKGSLCVDGISLTIAALRAGSAEFWITPHTLGRTHLVDFSVGRPVNLEADMLAKHLARLFDAMRPGGGGA